MKSKLLVVIAIVFVCMAMNPGVAIEQNQTNAFKLYDKDVVIKNGQLE